MPKQDLHIQLDGSDLDFAMLENSYARRIRVSVSQDVWARVRTSRRHVERIVKDRDRRCYGVNTGIGSLCDTLLPPEELLTLQENLLLSHAVGVGNPMPDELVRWMMLFKIHALCKGNSGVRRETIEALLRLLNADLLPTVPSRGSLGASGDLTPLAHMSLPLIGRGELREGESRVSAGEAMEHHKISPIQLGAKEGLALINGTQFMTAYGAGLCVRAQRACKTADIVAAMSLEAVRGNLDPFDEKLHELRPHPGAIAVARNVRHLLAERPAKPTKPYGTRVQDPYSLRCVPQVHGAVRDALAHAREVILRDINSVTDNPIVLDDGRVLSGGNFHGEPLALVLDYLACALAELASISERRQFLLINNGWYDLPPALIEHSGLNSGFLITQYTAASLVSENKVLCHPASVDSIPTAGGQEDHVSMGATGAVKCWQVMDNLEHVLAIELMAAAQALDFTPPHDIARDILAVREAVRQRISHADVDRQFGLDIAKAHDFITSPEFFPLLGVSGSALT